MPKSLQCLEHARCLSYTRCVHGMPDDIPQPDGTRKPAASRYFKKAQLARKVTVKTVSKSGARKMAAPKGVQAIYDVSHQRKEVTNFRHIQHATRAKVPARNARVSQKHPESFRMEREPAPTVSLETLIRQKSEAVPSWFPKKS